MKKRVLRRSTGTPGVAEKTGKGLKALYSATVAGAKKLYNLLPQDDIVTNTKKLFKGKPKALPAGKTAPLAKFAVSKAGSPPATKAGAQATKATNLAKLDKAIGSLKGKTAKLRNFNRLRKVAKFARVATPIGAATVVATSIKKRDPKAVKAERAFYKGKKYKDVGFESMMDYAKPTKKAGGGEIIMKQSDYIKDLL